MNKPHSFPLDLSALAYPMMRSRRAQSNFRYSARLFERVDPDLLLRSLTDVIPHYPNFRTEIRPSFFWHTFRESDRPLLVKRDDRPPLRPFRKEDTGGYPFRLAYREDEIVLEIFHAVTDGNVGALFLSDLLTRYVELREDMERSDLDRGLVLEDAFLLHARKKRLRDISFADYDGGAAVALGKGKKYRAAPILLSRDLPIDDLKAAAKGAGATLTELIAACYGSAILAEETLPLKKPLCLFLPIDMRRFFPSKTLQNFVCFERISLPKGWSDPSFERVLERVKEQFREKLTQEQMQRRVDDVNLCFNLPILKYLPLFLKSPAFRLGKKLSNKVRQTAILSNVGIVTLPPAVAKAVKEVKFFLNVNKNAPLNLSILSYGDRCNLNITCALTETAIPERFFSLLADQCKK